MRVGWGVGWMGVDVRKIRTSRKRRAQEGRGEETFCLFRGDCVVILLQRGAIMVPCVLTAAPLELLSSLLALLAFGFTRIGSNFFIETDYLVIFHKLCQTDTMYCVNVHPHLRERTGLSAKHQITGRCLSTNPWIQSFEALYVSVRTIPGVCNRKKNMTTKDAQKNSKSWTLIVFWAKKKWTAPHTLG